MVTKTNPADHNAARQEAMYRDEPKAGKGGDKGDASKKKEADNKAAGEESIHARHKRERDDAHDRHKKERDDMHKRHEDDHAKIDERQDAELAQATGSPADATAQGASMAAPVAAPAQAAAQA